MKDTKTIALLKVLTPKDLRQLKKMLQSPFFTTNPHLLDLFQLLRSCHPHFNSRKLDKHLVFRTVFPEHTYSDIKLRNLLRELTKILEDYFIFQEIKTAAFQRRKMLSKIYQKKEMQTWSEREIKKGRKVLDAQVFRDGIYFQAIYELNLIQLEGISSKQLKQREQLLRQTAFSLNCVNIFSQNRILSEQKSFAKIATAEQDIQSAEDYLNTNVVSNIYQQLITLYEQEDLKTFQQLKKYFSENISSIRPSLQLEFLTHLINFSIQKMRTDDIFFNKTTLELYQLGLLHKILLQNNRLSDTAFLNITTVAAKAKEFEWTKSFLENYQTFLDPKDKEEVICLGTISLLFHQHSFSEITALLAQQTFIHPFHKISARLYGIRCYYELFLKDATYFSLLIDHSLAMEKSIYRDAFISPEYSEAILNFSKFIRKLANQRSIGQLDLSQQDKLIGFLDQQKITISRSWLLKKIRE